MIERIISIICIYWTTRSFYAHKGIIFIFVHYIFEGFNTYITETCLMTLLLVFAE